MINHDETCVKSRVDSMRSVQSLSTIPCTTACLMFFNVFQVLKNIVMFDLCGFEGDLNVSDCLHFADRFSVYDKAV